jgi:Fur family peroxide stress response transcriptional regulator
MYSDETLRTIIDALRKKGFKATPQRIAICKAALQTSTHPTAQEIYKKVKEEYPTISLATVYKTLKVLKELNLVQELPFFQRKIRFDTNTKPHINLVCLKCGAIKDLNDPAAQLIVDKLTNSAAFKVNGQRIDIYGICKKCSQQQKDKN